MKKIDIVSKDRRFAYAKELFDKQGYICNICDADAVDRPDAVALSPRQELTDNELIRLASRLREDTVIFTGQGNKLQPFFSGRVIDYSENEAFLLKNAYITALCGVKLTLDRLCCPLLGKKALVIGYGRIGKYLSSMLKGLGASVCVYARREESRADAYLNGMRILDELSENGVESLDLVYNTVPYRIVSRGASNAIPRDAIIMELASAPGGFEDDSGVIKAPALPGRMMPEAAGKAIFDLIHSFLTQGTKGQ